MVIGFIGEPMEDDDIDNVVIQGEPSPEEIAESDREGIRIAAKEVNYDLTPAETIIQPAGIDDYQARQFFAAKLKFLSIRVPERYAQSLGG